jgi:predicted methyltransferase MtxX (methanogen marker protein 4)
MDRSDLDQIRKIRVHEPDAVIEAARTRKRRALSDRLLLVAADHPARGALAVGNRPMAMADRGDVLARLCAALSNPKVDGVLGTPDILEELLLLGALEDKVVIGSMNRGGLAGASFELDDRFTGYDAASVAAMNLDGGKMLTRIALDDPGSVRTLEACGRAVSELAERGLMAMIEPFMSMWVDGKVRNDLSPDAVIRSIAIANGLGNSSRHTWLKLPAVANMERVMRATTLPALILGGDPAGQPEATYADWEEALQAPGVCGLVVGRALLYPEDDDVSAAVSVAAELVHGGSTS